jgi:hypothetical protein
MHIGSRVISNIKLQYKSPVYLAYGGIPGKFSHKIIDLRLSSFMVLFNYHLDLKLTISFQIHF